MKKLNLLLFIILVFVFTSMSYSITVVEKIGGFTNSQVCKGHNNVIYILDHYKVISFDLRDGSFIDTLDLGEYVRNIDFSGDYAVVAGIFNTFLIDITNPSTMLEIDAQPVGMGSMVWDVAVEGDMVYVAAQSKALIYQLAGTGLSLRGTYLSGGSFPMIRSVEINGTTMYLGDSNIGISAIDVTVPSSPVVIAAASTPGNTVDLEVIPGRNILICADGAYFGMDSTSVRFFSIPTPPVITELSAWVQLGGDAIKTHSPNPYERLALADGEGGVKVIDYSDPTPYFVVGQPTADFINGVFVQGDTIFAAGMDTFYIMTTDAFSSDSDTVVVFVPAEIDSVQPAAGLVTACDPVFTWFFTEGSNPIDPGSPLIDVNGDFFTGFDIEVTVDADFVEIDMAGYPYYTGDTVVVYLDLLEDDAGSLAVGLGMSSFVVIDNSPPYLSGEFPAPGDSIHEDSVAITGQLVDIGLGGFNESEFRVIVNGISYSPAGMYLDYTAPNFVCDPMGVFSPGDEVEVCVGAVDLIPLEYCGPNELDTCWNFYIRTTGIDEARHPGDFAIAAYPNPFNSAITISVGEGLRPSRVEIFDASGRLIEKIKIQQGPNRTYEAVWKPEKHLPSGIYLIKTGGVEPIKVILLR